MKTAQEIIEGDLSFELKFRVPIATVVKLSKVQKLKPSNESLGELFEKLLENYLNGEMAAKTRRKKESPALEFLAPRIVRRNNAQDLNVSCG